MINWLDGATGRGKSKVAKSVVEREGVSNVEGICEKTSYGPRLDTR